MVFLTKILRIYFNIARVRSCHPSNLQSLPNAPSLLERQQLVDPPRRHRQSGGYHWGRPWRHRPHGNFCGRSLGDRCGCGGNLASHQRCPSRQKIGIPVLRRYQDLLKMKDVDLVIDVTGDPKVEQKLLEVQAPHLTLVGGASAKFMWQLD